MPVSTITQSAGASGGFSGNSYKRSRWATRGAMCVLALTDAPSGIMASASSTTLM